MWSTTLHNDVYNPSPKLSKKYAWAPESTQILQSVRSVSKSLVITNGIYDLSTTSPANSCRCTRSHSLVAHLSAIGGQAGEAHFLVNFNSVILGSSVHFFLWAPCSRLCICFPKDISNVLSVCNPQFCFKVSNLIQISQFYRRSDEFWLSSSTFLNTSNRSSEIHAPFDNHLCCPSVNSSCTN